MRKRWPWASVLIIINEYLGFPPSQLPLILYDRYTTLYYTAIVHCTSVSLKNYPSVLHTHVSLKKLAIDIGLVCLHMANNFSRFVSGSE